MNTKIVAVTIQASILPPNLTTMIKALASIDSEIASIKTVATKTGEGIKLTKPLNIATSTRAWVTRVGHAEEHLLPWSVVTPRAYSVRRGHGMFTSISVGPPGTKEGQYRSSCKAESAMVL